ncbi:hypothetical protein P148_SR1C00001G0492 [candidate division SR1 bacterium RAAC1_SR1_1]|nr:hypothetical protein P148_SR1C00001G0492 [candidate division SR1 bacterium RAAC1_SR1_1]
MKIDWFDFWLIFSGILLFFLLIGLIIRFFQWFKFRQELAYIKDQKIQDIVKNSQKEAIPREVIREVSKFKEEMDCLMKDVCFDLYDRNTSGNKETNDFSFDFEESLEKLLDGKILNLIKEKDFLLQQKDSVIGSLEEKNQKILREVVNKMFFLIMEKDKIVREKDLLIIHLKKKIQEIAITDLDQYLSKLSEGMTVSDQQKVIIPEKKQPVNQHVYHHNHTDFLDVNAIGKK